MSPCAGCGGTHADEPGSLEHLNCLHDQLAVARAKELTATAALMLLTGGVIDDPALTALAEKEAMTAICKTPEYAQFVARKKEQIRNTAKQGRK